MTQLSEKAFDLLIKLDDSPQRTEEIFDAESLSELAHAGFVREGRAFVKRTKKGWEYLMARGGLFK
jgi:hypothetical protein